MAYKEISKSKVTGCAEPAAVIICNTPLHILNALEAAREWEIDLSLAWLIIKPVPGASTHGLEGTARLGAWGRVLWVESIPALEPGRRFFSSLRRQHRYHREWQDRLVEARGRVSRVFVPLNRIKSNLPIVSWLNAQEVIWLDDGTLSAVIAKRRACPKKKGLTPVGKKANVSAAKELIKKIPFSVAFYKLIRRMTKVSPSKYVRAGLRRKVLKTLSLDKNVLPSVQTYFSANEMWPPAPGTWRKNRSLWFSERLQSAQSDIACVHFLGAPLVERDGISEDLYFEWLESIISQAEDKRFVYVLHPRESDEFANRLADRLKIETRRFEYPYEIEICRMTHRPSVVASWFCSALDNLGHSGASNFLKLIAYRIPLNSLESGSGEVFEAAIQFYRRHEFAGSQVLVKDFPVSDNISVQPLHD